MIYPSARCDVRVEIHNGEILSWSGWCLVDYRNMSTVREIGQFSVDLGPWKVDIPYPVTLEVGADGSSRAGSFSLVGVEEGQIVPLMDELDEILARRRGGGPD